MMIALAPIVGFAAPWLAGLQGAGPQKPAAAPGTLTRIHQPYTQERVDAAFLVWDRDGNAWLSYRELRAAMQIDRYEFLVMDHDGDGRVDQAELRTHLKRLLENGALLTLPESRPSSAPAPSGAAASHPAQAAGAASRPAGTSFRFGEGMTPGAQAPGSIPPTSKPSRTP